MSYVNGFVAAVPTADKELYREHCARCAVVFREAGAESIVDCWGDDVPDGNLTSFPMAVKKEPHETVVFGWIIWPSKAVCEAGMAKAMEDPRMASDQNPMPFDGKRLIYGGFEMMLEG